MRTLAILMLLLVAGQASGVAALVGEACAGDCGDERDGGACCPSSCASCVCAARAPTLVPETAWRPPLAVASADATLSPVDALPPSPDPLEILHVPRSVA